MLNRTQRHSRQFTESLAPRRWLAYVLIALLYAAAGIVGWLTNLLTVRLGVLPASLLGDIAATLVVWLAGVLCGNSSVYDPYWSVAPVVLMACWLGKTPSLIAILLMAVIALWGVRLTTNWAIRWRGIHHQDWRYEMLRDQMPRLWFLINLAGINLMPTTLVFLAMIPAYLAATQAAAHSLLSYLGIGVCVAAVAIELISDAQMERYKKDPARGTFIQTGLWNYSRHPNYFGEVLFWWGIWLAQAGCVPGRLGTILAPLLMTALFLFVSIPMMERHILQTRPEYGAYRRQVSVLIPLPRRKPQGSRQAANG